MGSQYSSPSLPSQVSDAGGRDSRPAVTEKFESVNKKASARNVGRTATEMPEEQNEKAHASKPLTDHRSTFFGLPIEIRNVIYSLVLTVEDSYSYGVSHGMICLADEPGYPPKLCDIDYMHTIDSKHAGYEYSEVYLTEDYEPLKPFISRKAEAWRIEINQLNKCSPEQQEHIRNVDIIELPLDDEQPRNPEMPVVVDSRTRLEHLMTLKLGKAFRPRMFIIPFQNREAFVRRRYAELTGNGDAASKYLYNICQQNPSLRVIVRYNEWQDMRQGGYREEKSGEGGGTRADPALRRRGVQVIAGEFAYEQLSQFSLRGNHPRWYFIDESSDREV
ncbi:hypothetical protein V490_08378 [Pseudogymnoascus sp. VKM F-3557]|nr:hypothetical protein V490_08378 [Pseudogymnoascus sp. VKM F-3557]